MLQNISKEWHALLFDSKLSQIRDKIHRVTQEELICPPEKDWFNWARILNSPKKIKVILIGMDPYPRLKDAHGLSFSSLVTIPPSLKNIYKCLDNYGFIDDNKYTTPRTGNLSNWSKQGVLLLNAALSTQVKVSGKHSKIWKSYMTKIILKISNYGLCEGRQYIFLLWGNHAQKLEKYIDSDYHIVMKWLHPSPMAQCRAAKDKKFINCDHFSEINEFLREENEKEIVWDPRYNPDADSDDVDSDDANPNKINDLKFIKESMNHELGTAINPKTHYVFTDGSCSGNGKRTSKGAYAAIFVLGPWKGQKMYGKLPAAKYYDSNIRAEGAAILAVFEKLKGSIISNNDANWTMCKIYTDSQFWIKMILEYMPRWSEQSFKRKKNPDMTKKILNLWNWIMGKGKYLDLIFVRSHNKNGWKTSQDPYKRFCHDNNNCVDQLATYAKDQL